MRQPNYSAVIETAVTTALVSALNEARITCRAYISPSIELGEFDIEDAYAIQKEFVDLWRSSDDIAGYKAAVTAAPMQRAFRLPGPISGVLFAEGAHNNNCTISAKDYRTLLIETELAFRVCQPISEPIANTDRLRELVSMCIPTIELADLGFGENKFKGQDLLATNSASGGWIEGPRIEIGPETGTNWQTCDLNEIPVCLSRDNKILHEALSNIVMLDQWQALLWLVNQVIVRGYVITPEHLLLTGAIGAAHPGKPGHYHANYGPLGQIKFDII